MVDIRVYSCFWRVLLLILLGGGIWSGDAFKGTVFQFSHQVSLSSGIKVRWTTRDPEWITFELSSPTKGYVGMGFSHSGTMEGSDIYIGWVDSHGTAHVKYSPGYNVYIVAEGPAVAVSGGQDYFAQANGAPVLDPKQDAELLAASENEHGTMIVFRRKWDTCDHRDYVIGDDSVFLLWAWGPDDPAPGSGDEFNLSYHGSNELSRGATGIRITSKQIHWKFPDDEENYPYGVHQYDFLNGNVLIPKADTYHHCKVIKFPQLEQRQNIIGYKMVVAPESQGHIQRVLLHECRVPQMTGLSETAVLEKYVDLQGWKCYGDEFPSDLKRFCSHSTLAILGPGYEGFKYPDHVGVEIGDVMTSTYYRLEIQYENSDGLYMIDNSGIRVFYTGTERENEGGLLVTGHRRSPFLTVPPHQSEFNVYGVCSAECMWNGLNPEATTVFAVHLHTQSVGKRARLKHIRNGKELQPIMVDNHMKAGFQDYRLLPREIKLMPGDSLVLQCIYETIKNETIIFGGLGGSEEMCEATLMYYPKGRLTDCRSQPELYQYLGAIGIMNATGDAFQQINVSYSPDTKHYEEVTPVDDAYLLEATPKPVFSSVLITSPAKLKNKYLDDHLARLNWRDDFFTKIVEQKWKNGLHLLFCTGNGRRKIPTSRHVVPYPVYQDYTVPSPSQPDKCFGWAATATASSHQRISKTFSLLILLCSIRLL